MFTVMAQGVRLIHRNKSVYLTLVMAQGFNATIEKIARAVRGLSASLCRIATR